ncbi:MAG: maleylacetate reductase [Actinomycetota bacterium]|nr:maleylacetate reductase [Actinomycetota bacterium]
MRAFTYEALPGRVVFGAGASRDKLAEEVGRLDAERVLLVATGQERELAEELARPLGERLVGRFTGVRPHVPIEVAERARSAAREVGADCLLSVGGGSTTGTAKAVALETELPIVTVPTTYAGSEMTPVYGLTSGQRKRTGKSLKVLPRVVIYDPELTFSLPGFITGPSAMNAMAHCVEAFYAPGANPLTSLVAEEGIRALASGVPAAVSRPEGLDGRTQTLYGAYLAGAAFAAAGGAIHHKICHVLGGAYDLPHAETHTVILPQAAAFNEEAIPEVMQRVARALGAEEAASGLYDLARRIGAPTALKDVGMKEENLDEAVALILEEAPRDNPRPVDEAGIRGLLEDAYAGRRPGVVAERRA